MASLGALRQLALKLTRLPIGRGRSAAGDLPPRARERLAAARSLEPGGVAVAGDAQPADRSEPQPVAADGAAYRSARGGLRAGGHRRLAAGGRRRGRAAWCPGCRRSCGWSGSCTTRRGLDQNAIAERLGIPRTTVATRMFRARLALRTALLERYGDAGAAEGESGRHGPGRGRAGRPTRRGESGASDVQSRPRLRDHAGCTIVRPAGHDGRQGRPGWTAGRRRPPAVDSATGPAARQRPLLLCDLAFRRHRPVPPSRSWHTAADLSGLGRWIRRLLRALVGLAVLFAGVVAVAGYVLSGSAYLGRGQRPLRRQAVPEHAPGAARRVRGLPQVAADAQAGGLADAQRAAGAQAA